MPNPSLLVAPVNAIAGFPVVPAGVDRIAVLEVNYFRTNAGNITVPTTVTVGGIPGTYFAGDAPGSTQDRTGLTAWSFTESQIAAISGGVVSIAGGTLGTQTRAVGYVIQDTKQGSILNQATARISTGSLSIPLTRAANSYTMFAGFVEFNESVTITNPPWVALIGNVNFAYAADTARTANTTTQSKTYRQTGHVVNFESVPPQTITSVNGGAGIKIGSTGNTAVTNGFPSAPNAGTFGGKPVTVTAYDPDTKVATFNGPVVVGGESFPAFTGTQTLVLTNGTESASLAGVPIAPPDGSTHITVASPENVDTKAFGHILVAEGVTPEDGDTFYGVDADVDWLPTTFGSAVDLPVVTPVNFRKTSTGIAYELMLTVNGEGVISEPPVMPADASVSVQVGATILGTFAATSGTEPITYSISGTSAGLFTINASTALVSFQSPATLGVGTLTVEATNAEGSDSQDINFEVVEAVVPTIVSVGTVRIGGTADVSVSNFEGAISSGTLDGKALTAASNTSITMAALADGVATYRPGLRSLSLSDGEANATANVPVLAPSGWGSYLITGDFVEAVNGSSADYLPVGWAEDDFILFANSPSVGKTTTVTDAGVVTNNVGTQELFLVDATTGMATAFDIVTTSGAEGVGSGGASDSEMTMIAITMRGL